MASETPREQSAQSSSFYQMILSIDYTPFIHSTAPPPQKKLQKKAKILQIFHIEKWINMDFRLLVKDQMDIVLGCYIFMCQKVCVQTFI